MKKKIKEPKLPKEIPNWKYILEFRYLDENNQEAYLYLKDNVERINVVIKNKFYSFEL